MFYGDDFSIDRMTPLNRFSGTVGDRAERLQSRRSMRWCRFIQTLAAQLRPGRMRGTQYD
jgi:hypothetical protein